MALNKTVRLTQEGLQALENELEHLKTVKRKEVSEKIKVALSFGDLSENSEYDEAKNEQAMVEARVNELETILKNVEVVNEDDITTDTVSVGSTVMLKNLKNGREDTYKIVGSTEAAPMKKKISDESPVGKAVLGHKQGETVDVEVPSGIIQYQILEISK
jgi:transcription elongation factor GreA